MKIKFLGTSFGAPSKGRHQQSILLETDSGNSYLFDAGAPVLDILVNENYDLTRIKGIFLSHMHGDHIDGIFDVLYLAAYFGMKFRLYVPDEKGMQFLKSYMQLQNIKNCDWITYGIIAEGEFLDKGIKVRAIATNHMDKHQGNSFGFVVESDAKKLYISGDLHSSLIDFPLFEKDDKIDFAITECAHFDADDIIYKLNGFNINKAAIVHVMPAEKYEDIRNCMEKSRVKIILPSDGDVVEI